MERIELVTRLMEAKIFNGSAEGMVSLCSHAANLIMRDDVLATNFKLDYQFKAHEAAQKWEMEKRNGKN